MPAITLYDHYKENFETFLTTDKRGHKYINNKNLFLFFISIIKSFFYLRKKKIDFLFSTGGYMSLPLCLCAKLLKIKIILFEPNMTIGRSNKFFLKYSSKIICYSNDIRNFPLEYKYKIFLIKSLLRKQLYNEINIPPKILIIGGSQGANFFDEKISELVIELFKDKKVSIIQQVSDKKKIEALQSKYNQVGIDNDLFKFNNEIYKKYHDIDFAITRSGASTIMELVFFKIPFLAIPFPKAKDNHQFYNAKNLHDKNLCWLINQNEFRIDEVKKFLLNLMLNKDEFFLKKKNMEKFSYQNTWNDVNQKLISLINEN